MRFKAKLAPEQVALFHSLIVPMTRLGASGNDHVGGLASSFTRNGTILYLDSDHVRLSCKGKSHEMDGIACFAELAAQGYSSIFLDRRIESAAPNHAILMELDLTQLRLALKSVLGGGGDYSVNQASLGTGYDPHRYAIIKLAKRQNIPCLCIDACSVGGSGKGAACTIQVHHAIPVRILRHSEMQHHLPPPVQLPDVQLELQSASAANLRTVIDRLKGISPTMYIEANMKGELTISSHTDGASIQTFFSKLTPRFEDCKPVPSDLNPASSKTRIKIDTKKLSASLQWQTHQSQMISTALLCLVENEMVVIHVNLNPVNVGFFTYYVPVHYLSRDPCED